MTHFEAIRRADQRMKNDIPTETKKRWLDGLQAAKMGEKQGREEEMNIEEAIRRADQRMPNTISLEKKIEWLKKLQEATDKERGSVVPLTADVAEAYLVMRCALEENNLTRYNTWAKIFNNRVTDFIMRGARA